MMQKLFFTSIVVLLTTCAMAAEQPNGRSNKPDKMKASRPASGNHCAQYGPGFVPVGNTTTCIKIGGGVTFEGGGRR
jgi:hypothetical protein